MENYLVRIGGQTYTAESEQPLINFLPSGEVVKGCLKGVCRVCRCKLISGSILENGKKVATQCEFLPCISRVDSDSEIKSVVNSFQLAKVDSITLLSEQIMEIALGVKNIFYNAKSIVTIKHPKTGILRNYSVVVIGKKFYDKIYIHVKLRSGGLFSTLFTNIYKGDHLEFTIFNPLLPCYDVFPEYINVVSGGSGMGAALSRAQELAQKYNVRGIEIFAINRAEISNYHSDCINRLSNSVDSKTRVINIPFHQWVSPNLDIDSYLNSDFLTIGVGSDAVISKLKNMPLCELESFG